MHPPLHRPHPLCKLEVEALVRCHEDRFIAKWFNACGTIKEQLNECFRVCGIQLFENAPLQLLFQSGSLLNCTYFQEEKVLRRRLNTEVRLPGPTQSAEARLSDK